MFTILEALVVYISTCVLKFIILEALNYISSEVIMLILMYSLVLMWAFVYVDTNVDLL